MGRVTSLLVIGLSTIAGVARTASAQPDRERRWTNTADFGLVTTGGNSSVTTLALSDNFTLRWAGSELSAEGSALRTESRARALSNPDGSVRVTETRETTAEEYRLGARFRHRVHESLFGFTSAGWERNELAGVRNRFRTALGLGYGALQREGQTLAVELGVDWTNEQQVAGGSDNFAGAQARLDYRRRLSESAVLEGDLEVLENLKDVNDLRVNLTAAVTSSISKVFAVKIGFDLNYDRQPADIVVQGDAQGVPPAVFTFDPTDTRLSASLVVNF